MSQNASSPGPDLGAGTIESISTAPLLLAAVAALIFYEYAILLGQEVTVVWQRKLSPASLLLLTIRWTLLFEAISLVLPQPSPEAAIFAGLRVFAITNHNYILSLVVLILILTPVITNSYAIAIRAVALPFIGPRLVICTPKTLISNKTSRIALCGRIPVIVGESITIVLTWKKAYRRQQILVNIRGPASLTQTLICDGTVYFMVMMFVNIAEILVLTHGQSTAFAGPFLDALPPILICRFIMNLRRSSDHSGYTKDSQVELDLPGEIQTKSVVFRHFNQGLDEFGRSLDVGGSRTRSNSTTSWRNRGGSVLSESTMEDYSDETGIILAVLKRSADSAAPLP
ncbi:uncharacterized protein PHACADRAFT_199589 [Phanerochaete carnosa HHB-10118-sp]|uniref:DUF6533 domain-containing protein n=1 Tax=Phanerochaete carnosa (strain HHB-10118-sp) TaxID=650164 RepID=K5VL05_PHACS|nr:uncharacterized protein PHACADRAFT_199589 [Phanerochaete carnosa HHB-10118-sp]EKM52093.1 hypothetical protein PHACADRAFT_199589 [Phanerochaete carnosa HHB-10118-sp]